MGYRGGYLSGLDFAVDMLGFQPVAHKYQRGDNSIIAYNLDFFFRIVEVHFPTGLQLDDQIAPSQMVRTLTEFGGSLVPVSKLLPVVTSCTPLNSCMNSAALFCKVVKSSLASSIALRFK